MIKFQCIFDGVCLQFRQSNVLIRGVRSKAILGSQCQNVQSSKYGCSGVKTWHWSPLLKNNNNNNVNNFRSSSTLGNETVIKSARQQYSFHHACPVENNYKNNDKFNTKFKAFSPTTIKRQFSTSSDNVNKKDLQFYSFGLMKFHNKPAIPPQPIPVNFFKQFMNKLVALTIRMEHDRNFSVESLLEGAKMAILTVSATIAEGRFDQLEGLVEEQARKEIQFNCSMMSERKRRLIEMREEDCSSPLSILYLHGIRIIHRTKDDVKLEASVVLSCIRNSQEILPHEGAEPPPFSELNAQLNVNLQLCNYIFHKKLVKDTETSWIIHRLEHFGFLGEKDRI